MKATREELCLFHYPDVTHKGYWKVFLQWRVFYKFSEKQICPICASKCLTHAFRTQGSQLLFTYYLFHVYITSPFICSKASHLFLVHLVSTHLNSALISHQGAPTPLVPKWNFYASSLNPAPLPVSSVSTGTTLWKSCSLAPPLFFFGARDETQGPENARQTFSHWATSQDSLRSFSSNYLPIPIVQLLKDTPQPTSFFLP